MASAAATACWRYRSARSLPILALSAVTIVLAAPPPTPTIGSPGATFLGARGAVSAGVDAWTGGGGPAVLGQLDLGVAGNRGGPWTGSARYGGWAEVVGPIFLDGHAADFGVRHRSGLGVAASAAGSASVRWGEVAALGSAQTGSDRISLSGAIGPVARLGVDSAIGARGSGAIGIVGSRLEPWATVQATAWAGSMLPHLAQAALSLRWTPRIGFVVTPGVSGMATGAGGEVATAGLPPANALIGRASLAVGLALNRTFRLTIDGAFEAGPGYRRGIALAGVSARLGRLKSRGTEQIAPGQITFEVRAPDAERVAVAGTFTQWAPTFMTQQGSTWVATISVPPGTHEYVYLVDDVPVVPPEATLTRPDGFGGTNGVIVVGAPDDQN